MLLYQNLKLISTLILLNMLLTTSLLFIACIQ